MSCNHNLEKIHTYLVSPIPINIIDTNYQCTVCGEVLTPEEAQDFLSDKCGMCYGSGKIEYPYEGYINCPACLLDNVIK